MEVELKKGVTIMTNAALHLPAAILNRAFSKRSGLPLAHFELYYGGTRLEGEATLSSYGVDIHSSVEVKMRGRGGMNGDGSRSGGKGRMKPAPQVDPASTMAGIDARRLATRFFVEANEGDTPTALRSMPLLGALLTLQNRQASFDWSFLQAAALGALALNGQVPGRGKTAEWRAACNDNRLGPETHPLLIVLRLMADVVRPLLVEAVTDTSTPSLVAGRAALERRSTTQQDEAAQLCAWLLTQLPPLSGDEALLLAKRFCVEANEGDTPTALRSMPLLGALLTLQNRQASFDWSFLQAAALGALALNGQVPGRGKTAEWRAACNDNRLGPETHPLLIVLRLMADVVRPLLVEAVTDTSTPSLVAGRAALERRSTTQQDEAAQLCAWLLTQLPTESNPTESNPSTSSRQRRVIRPRTPAEPASSKLPKRKTAMKVSDNDAGDMALATVMEQLSAARDAAREVLNDVHGLLKTAIENGSSNLSHNDV